MFATTFENEENDFRKKKTALAIFTTTFIHGVILFLLLFFVLHTPIPPFEDNAGGMSVNYGTDASGIGNIQPFTYNPGPAEASTSAKANSARQTESAPENAITSENSETDVVMHKADDKPKPKVNKKAIFKPTPKTSNTDVTTAKVSKIENPVPQPKPDPNALFSKGAYGRPNNSKGDGTGGVQGDQGNPEGDPNSRNYIGGGDGSGQGHGHGDLNGGYSLHGRTKLSLPAPALCNNQGKVVIEIDVNRDGKVVNADFKRFSSTVFDECNINNALDAARRATFNADASAPEIQHGTITYKYEIH